MATLFDRLNRELEEFGRKAQVALDEGKLQIELLRLRRQRDNAAADLGLLVHQRERGTDVDQRRIDALLLRLDDLAEAIARVERRIAELRGERVSVNDRPAPGSAAPADQELAG
ncbi:MAG TPA: hypothetical protein VNK43_09325 [Gemmatimonadales bacterium]|nr:hypothetical protein [Gemmatimonadales bacterium]